MKNTLLVLAVLCVLLLCLLPAELTAQQLASQKRGLSAVTGYQLGDVDHVNLFNGGLTLALPLGTASPVAPSLSYQLTLTARSNGWDHVNTDCDGITLSQPRPDVTNNAGFAWSVHLGRLLAPRNLAERYRYLSPDGAQHAFYGRLHPTFRRTSRPTSTIPTIPPISGFDSSTRARASARAPVRRRRRARSSSIRTATSPSF